MAMNMAIVDVFAAEKYAGNQLAVFWGGDLPETATMQKIAKEMNFSETTFVAPGGGAEEGYDVRIFTPAHEVPFAGHPTLGTAHIIRERIAPGRPDDIVLNLKAGSIPVICGSGDGEEKIYWMQQLPPTFGARHAPGRLAAVLGLDAADLDDRFPIEEVSTGLPHIIVPVRTLEAQQNIRVDKDKYFALVENAWAKLILVFCPQPRSPRNHFSVRMFAAYLGIAEDPATGSGNGCLAGYLVRHRYLGAGPIGVRCEQGYEIGRPSLLHLAASEKDDTIAVKVGGTAITVAVGELVE